MNRLAKVVVRQASSKANLSVPLCGSRFMSTPPDPLNRPSPPPLPREQQREFEELVRRAQAPLSQEAELTMHPDARPPVEPEFEGDVNPRTGERGGPKREPVKKWTEEGDWSFKGRVSDF